MNSYVKLINNKLEYFDKVPNICCPNEATKVKYALENGYKELVTTAKPHKYSTLVYSDLKSSVKEKWIDINVKNAKILHLKELDDETEKALSLRARVKVDNIGEFVFDTNSQLNLTAQLLLHKDNLSTVWIDVNNNVVELDYDKACKISEAFEQHKMTIYTEKVSKTALINAASTTSEVAAIDLSYNITPL